MTREQYLAAVFPSRVSAEPIMVPAGMESEHANDTSEVPAEGPAPPVPNFVMEGPRDQRKITKLEDLPPLPPLSEQAADSDIDEDLFSTPPESVIEAIRSVISTMSEPETVTSQSEMKDEDWLWDASFNPEEMFDMPSPTPSEEDTLIGVESNVFVFFFTFLINIWGECWKFPLIHFPRTHFALFRALSMQLGYSEAPAPGHRPSSIVTVFRVTNGF